VVYRDVDTDTNRIPTHLRPGGQYPNDEADETLARARIRKLALRHKTRERLLRFYATRKR